MNPVPPLTPRVRLLALGLALITLLVYLPVQNHGFTVYDDGEYLTENRVVQAGLTGSGIRWAFTSFHASLWIPATWISHMVDCELFGLDPGAHHLVNALLHAVNAALFFWVFWRQTGALWPCLFAAALFAWHPLRVESVAWATERKDLLSTFFGLWTFYAYGRYAQSRAAGTGDRPGHWYGMALTFFALGLMSKPMLVTLPCVLLLLDLWPLRRVQIQTGLPLAEFWRLTREKWPFFALSAAVSVITVMAAHGQAVSAEHHGLAARAANAALAYGRYLGKMLWPVDLAVIYPLASQTPWLQAVVAAGLVAGLTWLAWRVRRDRPYWLAGWLWFLGMLVPVSGLVQVGTQAMADRFTYMPMMGLALAVAFEAARLLGRLRWPAVFPASAAALILGASLWATHRQLGFWSSDEALFRRALQVNSENPAAHASLGVVLEQQGKMQEAREHYEAALRLTPNLPQVHNNLANLLDAAGEPAAALEHYREAVRLRPGAALAHANLGTALAGLGRFDEAQRHYEQAERLAPRDPRPYYLMGKALLRQGRGMEAIERFRKALGRDPNDVQTLVFLARVLAADTNAAARNGAEAVAVAMRANQLTAGESPVVLDTLAMALAEAGRFAEARAAAEQALQLATAAKDTHATAEINSRLEYYKGGQAWREDPARANAP